MDEIVFPAGAFQRLDEEDDRVFYAWPRKVVHLDDAAIAALMRLYGAVVTPTGCVLDLMASWRSHLPLSFRGTVIGLGLNREEMRDNPQLGQALVHDLNHEPRLPLNDEAFDAALCAVSVQYMTHPVEVFREVRRTLKPGAPFVVSFSNRCFPEKAVALWRAANDAQHVAIVTTYFRASGSWEGLADFAHTPPTGDPLYAVRGIKTAS